MIRTAAAKEVVQFLVEQGVNFTSRKRFGKSALDFAEEKGMTEIIGPVVDEWLARTPGLRPELVAYAQRAKIGNVL